jgi:heparin binding hemagglutinin HbhA
MALVADIRKTVTGTTPVLAAVGLTDLAVEKVRDARVKVASARVDVDPAKLQNALDQGKELPALALNRSLELAGMARQRYESYASRGEKLVQRVRTQKATTDLIAQAEATFALGKGAVTTVRKSATDIQRSAKATITTGRKEAVVAADAIADSVVDEATEATSTVTEAATRTRTAAKRTATTTRKSATASKSATKRATTGTRKTAAAAKKAGTTAAAKVGD